MGEKLRTLRLLAVGLFTLTAHSLVAQQLPKLDVGVSVAIDEQARKEIEQLRKTLQESLLALADAIPGGRYTRLVEDLHGGNLEKRQAAQEFLKSLAGLDPQVDYQLSVWFEFDPKKPLHAIVFRAALPIQDEIQTRYKQANITNAFEVSSTPLTGPKPGQIRDEIAKALSNAVDQVPIASHPYDITISDYNTGRPLPAVDYAGVEARKTMLKELLSAFNTFYREWNLPLQSTLMTIPWPLFDERQTLFVLIPEDDWKAHGGQHITVKALLHKKGDPKTPLPGAFLVSFNEDEWKAIELRDTVQPPRNFRWAVHTMTDTLLISSSTAQRLQAVRDALAKWDKARADQP